MAERHRHMMKWQAFESLPAYVGCTNTLGKQRIQAIPSPPSEDDYERMNRLFNEAFSLRKDLTVTFFSHGQTRSVQGKITRLNELAGTFVLNDQIIYLRNVTDCW